MTIRYLDWDSSFFGLRIGQVDTDHVTDRYYNDLIIAKRTWGYDLVYWITDGYEYGERELTREKLPDPVDIKITFFKTDLIREETNPLNIEKYNGPVTGKLIELAIESGHKSRFRKDPRLNGRFSEMYTTWISKSVSGELADVVLVSKALNDINGFITIKNNGPACIVGLIAVDQMFRGQGIGGGLLKSAGNWCIKEGCTEIRVPTQMENQGACRLYERNGYIRLSTKYIFHI